MLLALPVAKENEKLVVPEYTFDAQLLAAADVYRESRKQYLKLGGKFSARVCSTMRGLSAQDLFKNDIEYSPALSELIWFKDYGHAVGNAYEEMAALVHFNEISLFHEQNHRVIWQLLPPVPTEPQAVRRYLNFAESLVVVLDLVLGDQLGKKLSTAFERMKILYRPGGEDSFHKKSKEEYRNYLMAVLASTYYSLERIHPDDILPAVNYVLPGQKSANKAAVKRGMQLSEIFTNVTNPQWQSIYWSSAVSKLKSIQKGSKQKEFLLPEDPLDLESEFIIAKKVFEKFGV
jgi:hypothetical protein